MLNPAELLQAYSELQQRFQRTTNALGSAAHDLKTPLAILNGYVELLQSEKLGPLNDRQREVLRDMQSSGKRLQQFIQDFLTYSALETGGLKMQFATGNINQCLSEVCRLWSTRFQEKGLALYFLANDKLPVFPFDSPKLERVISNLLENSFKFVPRGGTVWLHAEPYMWERRAAAQPASAGERRRQDTSQPNAVKVSVSDTGPGIPAEFHQEVFDDFFRLPGNENQEGMGLGLIDCAPPGAGHGWKSLGGKRSRRGLQILISHSLQTFPESCWQRKESMSEAAKILLVDDEPAMLRYIRTLLEVDDYKVETASTGEEALQRIDKGMEPDLVLLDVLMPGIDGLETLEQLRQKRPGVKVVMLSCVNDTKKVVQAMRLGAHDYLTKPFQKAELDAVIDQCLGQGKTPVGGEVEEVGDDVFFIAASPAMRKIRSQAALGRAMWIFPYCCWARAAPARKCWPA